MAFVALVPLLLSVEGTTPRGAFWRGALTGTCYLGILPWIIHCVTTYADMGFGMGLILLILLCLILASFMGAAMALSRYLLGRFELPMMLVFPACWVCIELVRSHIPVGGFTWAILGYSQHENLSVIQIAEITGVYGVSFLILMVNVALYQTAKIWVSQKNIAWQNLIVGLGTLIVVLCFGHIRISQVDKAFETAKPVKLGLVQGNIDQGIKWSSSMFWKNLSQHLLITKKLLAEKPDMVIWPEVALTTNFNYHWQYRTSVVKTLEQVDSHLLVGALSQDPGDDEAPLYNSAYLLSPGAENLVARYDKIHLVPFSEYVPMQQLIFFIDAIAGGYTGSTTPGKEIVVFNAPDFSFGCVVCYEVIFGNLVRQFVKQGAGFMTTITNDAWFGRGSAPYQHHSTIPFRCVENRVYFARSANTGISSFVDPAGRVLEQSDIYVEAGLIGTVKLSPMHTIYTSLGDVFAYLCSAFCAILLLWGVISSRSALSKSSVS